jgi:hypothetical protein
MQQCPIDAALSTGIVACREGKKIAVHENCRHAKILYGGYPHIELQLADQVALVAGLSLRLSMLNVYWSNMQNAKFTHHNLMVLIALGFSKEAQRNK